MFLDALNLVDDAHAYTGAAVSQRSIDLGDITPKRNIGTGKPVGFAFFADVLADSTTVKLEVITTTDEALSAGIIVLAEQTRLAADLPAGGALFMQLPPQGPTAGYLRYIGVRCTPAGGNATVTLTVALMPLSMFSVKAKAYAKGYTIS